MSIRKKRSLISAIAAARAVLLVSLAIVGASGVAYAALQSQDAKLTGNTIQTATAGLVVSNDSGVTFSTTASGFAFNALVPGGSAMPATGFRVFLKNVGSVTLAIKLSAASTLTNSSNVDLTKVHVILTPLKGGSVQNFTLKALIDSAATGGLSITSATSIQQGNMPQFTMQVSMDADALTGDGATISNVDFSFSGVSVTS